jgi:hypothetical protein
MSFLPAAQNNRRRLLWALNELRYVAGNPAGILLLHQASFGRRGYETRTRGPLTAFADILIDMRIPAAPPADRRPTRRRHFTGVGRYPGTFESAVAELNAAGTDYVLLPDALALGTAPALGAGLPTPPPLLETVRQVLQAHPEPLTRQQILAHWPPTQPPPRGDTLWRTLTQGCELGLLHRTGEGNKAEAYRYGVAEGRAAG